MDNTGRRTGRAALVGLAAAAFIGAVAGLVIGQPERRDVVQTRGVPSSTLGSSTLGNTTPAASEPSTTGAPAATGTVGSQPPQTAAPTAPPSSPWRVSATTALTNLAPVNITATRIPSDTYFVGQCPAGEVPSFDACVLNDTVTVSDGTLTSTVRAFWWLKGGQVDCGSAPGACVVGVMNTRTGVTVASFPISFNPARRPTITVTPRDALTDGQTVMVRGVDIGEGMVRIGECLLPGDPACTFLKVESRPDGTFSAALHVSRVIDWFGRGGPESSVCGVDGDCVVEVWLIPKGFDAQSIWINPAQPVDLQFVPGPPPTSTTLP